MSKELIVQRDESLRQAAFTANGAEQKAEAVWEFFRRLNLDTVLHRQKEIWDEICIAFGGRSVSAKQILDFTNKSAYEVHLSLVKHGYSYQALREAFQCDTDVCTRLYQLTLGARGKLIDAVASIAKGMEESEERSTPDLVRKSLEIWGDFYPASHVVTQYCKEQSTAEPPLFPSKK
jgi:hypothetical protein